MRSTSIDLAAKIAILLSTSFVLSGTSFSQKQQTISVPNGTIIPTRLTKAVASKTAHAGDAVTCEVADDVLVSGSLIAKKSAPCSGSVTDAERARHLGHGAKLVVDIQKVQAVDGQWLAVHASQAKNGKNANPNVAAGTAFLVIFGGAPGLFYLLKHGKETELPAGTIANTTTVVDQIISLTPGNASSVPPSQP